MSESQPPKDKAHSRQSYLAVASLVSGLASIPLLPFVIFSVVAIITAFLASKGIQKSPASRNARTMALGGATLGFFSLAVGILNAPTVNIEKAKKVTSLATATALESAIASIYTEYGKLPDVGKSVTTNSPAGLKLLNILLGLDNKSDNALNPRGIKFLSVKDGKNHKNGLIYAADGKSIEGLFDPWGSPYTVILDTEYKEYLHFTLGSKTIDLKGRRSAVFSPGPDKQLGTSDDVKTW